MNDKKIHKKDEVFREAIEQKTKQKNQLKKKVERLEITVDGLADRISELTVELKKERTSNAAMANDINVLQLKYRDKVNRYKQKIDADADIKRKLLLQIKELGGDITVYDSKGIVI
jgi:septal ring factor EnvC (AmiA/AmiB activator)